MGDQSLGFGQLQHELIPQEITDLRLDLLRQSRTPATKRPHRTPVSAPYGLRDLVFDATVPGLSPTFLRRLFRK